jgi:hypothetical protein
VDDPWRAGAEEYADDVEAEGIEIWLSPGEVLLGQGADGGLLAGGDGLEWMPETDAPAQLHFDEDERLGLDVQTLELRFRALLTEGGTERLDLSRVHL